MTTKVRKIPEGQWQCNSYPDEGCWWSRGYKCVDCPFDECLDEYPVKDRVKILKELKEKIGG